MKSKVDISTTDRPTLRGVVEQLANELRRAEMMSSKVEGAMLGLIPSVANHNPEFISDIQHLDHQIQVLNDLARFLDVLSQEVPEEQLVDISSALGELRLRDVANALGQGDSDACDPDGDMEML